MTDDEPVTWLYMRIREHSKMKNTKSLARVDLCDSSVGRIYRENHERR
jgi:hypothetical protein